MSIAIFMQAALFSYFWGGKETSVWYIIFTFVNIVFLFCIENCLTRKSIILTLVSRWRRRLVELWNASRHIKFFIFFSFFILLNYFFLFILTIQLYPFANLWTIFISSRNFHLFKINVWNIIYSTTLILSKNMYTYLL